MDRELKQSYFTGDAGLYFYVGDDRCVHSGDITELLELHEKDHSEFQRIIEDISSGNVGMCKSGCYLCIDTDADSDNMFQSIPKKLFEKLRRDPDTIRLRYSADEIMLLQYNPEVLVT